MTVHVGLNGLADYSAAQPFINVLKCGRPWQGRSPTQFTSHSEAVMRSGGHLDADGNPIRIPPGADRVGTIILTEINAADTTLNGRYRLTWTGEGTLHLHGVSNIQRGNGFAEFDYRATGTNLVAIELTEINAANPLKLVACVRTDHIARHAAGEMFRPAWLDQVRGFPLFRFMDWQATNNSTQRVWADRTRASSYSYVPGAPVEVMVALCNLVGADPWFCYPHLATDDYITRFAQYVRTNLRADLTAHYEFSNEVWNFMFGQAQWANEQALRMWPDYVNQDGWMQFYGARSAEMADLIDAVYAGTTGRHRKVISTHTAWVGLEHGILEAPRWVAMQAGRQTPKTRFDDYAVTGYFGHGLGAQQVQDWRAFGESEAFTRMTAVLDREITGLEGVWRRQKAIADKADLRLVMYEGGSHVTPDQGVLNRNPGLSEFIEKFHYSAHMGRLYTRAISAFQLAGGEAFNVFVEMARSGRHGFWGGLRHAADSNPRWDAVKAALDGTDVTPAPVDPLPVDPAPEPEPTPEPTPTPKPTPEEPDMPDRAKLAEVLAVLRATTADLQSYLSADPVVTPPAEPDPVEPPVASRPIWQTAKLSKVSAPAEVFAPAGQNVAWVPVTLDHTDMQTVLLRVSRAQNANPATINVGANQAAYLPKDVYRWSPGDDLTHYVRLQLPGSSYRDGQQVIYHLSLFGADRETLTVKVTFRENAQHPNMPPQIHRAAYKLDLSDAVRANDFDPATLKHSDSGFDKDGKPCWRSRLSHGYSQPGNGETGLYMNEERFPDLADRPVTYDVAENAIRLHTKAAPDNAPYMHDRVAYDHQAAMIQGQTLDDVCGSEGVWRMEAKCPTRQYSWPAFWAVGRGIQGAKGGYTEWPPEIDFMEQFNRSWGAAYTEFTTSCGQHYGNAGSNNRVGAKSYVIETDKILGSTEKNSERHSYAGAVVWKGNEAWVTFFFDDMEIATQVLLARHQDMKTRLSLYPMANVAVRSLGGNADSYNNDPRPGDMLIYDIGYFPSGYRLV